MPLQAVGLVGPVQAGEVEGHAVDESVYVGPEPDARKLLHTAIMPERESMG
jgi:hypothetical protein